MKYALLFYQTKADLAGQTGPDGEAKMGAWMDYIGSISEAGIMRGGAGLQHPSTATTVRTESGKNKVQDGPFADTKEQLGGFVTIEVADLDAALEWASRAPCASSGSVEVRPTLPES